MADSQNKRDKSKGRPSRIDPRRARERVHTLFNPPDLEPTPEFAPWRRKAYEVIFEADTFAGRAFDLSLLVAILLSVAVVVLDSVPAIHGVWGTELYAMELVFAALFSLEYGLRLLCVKRPIVFAGSFFGLVDLLALTPIFFGLFFEASQSLLVVRLLRVLRIFRLLRLNQFVGESEQLAAAILSSRHKIAVFLGTVLTVVVIMGALMVIVEGPERGFTSIPTGMYWAIVTLTTVGYGDLAPATALGRALSALIMLLGYAIIAVPTGIVTVELAEAARRLNRASACARCSHQGSDSDANYCSRCGERLPQPTPAAEA